MLTSRLNSSKPTSKAYYRSEGPTSEASKGILIQNLTGKLAEMGEKDLRRLFAPFGEINVVDIQMNPVTGKNQGFAIVKFCAAPSATSAIKAMNGYVVNGSPLLVTQLSPYLTMGSRPSRLNDDDKVAPRQSGILPPCIYCD